jgi:carbon storage regulator CsrA
MLVLSRKSGEAIVLPGYGVTVTVVKIAGKRVTLGVCAPGNVAVWRRELAQSVGNCTPSTDASKTRGRSP